MNREVHVRFPFDTAQGKRGKAGVKFPCLTRLPVSGSEYKTKLTEVNEKKTIIKTTWIPCLTIAFTWLIASVLFTPIESGSGNTRLGYLLYGLFQLVTFGWITLLLMALSIIVLDLVIFRKGKFSRQQMLYETLILIISLLIIGFVTDALMTVIPLCVGLMVGQTIRGFEIENRLHSKGLN